MRIDLFVLQLKSIPIQSICALKKKEQMLSYLKFCVTSQLNYDAVILYIAKKNILDGLKGIVYFKRLFSLKSEWISNRIH